MERPALKNMLDEVNNNDIDVLVLYTQNRLSRDLYHSIKLVGEILGKVKRIDFVQENRTTETDQFLKVFIKEAAAAQVDRRRIRAVIMHTKKVKVISQNAYSSTFKPLGYIRNKEGKLLPATLENGATLNQVAQLRAYRLALLAYLSGYSMRRIATLLEEEFGLTPRGKKWSHKSVKSILENPIYAQIMRSKFLKAS